MKNPLRWCQSRWHGAAALERANLEPALYIRVDAAMREEGPRPDGSDEAVLARVRELARECDT